MNETNTDKAVHVEGRKWDSFGPFPSFEDCLKEKSKIMIKNKISEKDFDIKVKALSSGFHLKTRLKESVLLEIQKMIDEEEQKKKEKKRLNKKQRD